MGGGTKKIGLAKQELTELNDRFHSRSLLSETFYRQLTQAGFAYRRCLLISIFPDGGATYCGKLIRQDGRVVKFDIDLDFEKFSSWEDVTEIFNEMYEKNKNVKPWLKEVIAYDLFREMQKNSEQ